jgi:hypothetical protein
MIDADELDAVEVHGMLRVVRESVDRYIDEHRHNTGS